MPGLPNGSGEEGAADRARLKAKPLGIPTPVGSLTIGRNPTDNSTYTYWLPSGPDNKRQDYTTDTNSVIIVGANGTGKSKLGAWMEMQDSDNVHRIGAQRDINISEHIQQKSYTEASEMLLYGNASGDQKSKGYRWGWNPKDYTIRLLKDFDDTLAALIALHNDQNQRFVEECREQESHGGRAPHTRKTALENVLDIWDGIFPARELLYSDGQFSAKVKGSGAVYPAREMSDGERSVLYLAAQVLSIPTDDKRRLLIMDEPEVHLNRSLLSSLWSKLEAARPDCLFIYITHDVDFATSHTASDKVWVRDYDGKNWGIELLEDDESLPEGLLISLLGNRRPILFVEGDRSGLDYAVYSVAYPNWQVIPVGGCSQVIESVRAFRANSQMHSYKVHGIIDRDYRSEKQLATFEKEDIHHLEVAEVENIFLVEPVMRVLAKRFSPEMDAETIISEVKSHIIEKRFAPRLEMHEENALQLRLKNELAGIGLSSITIPSAASDVHALVDKINPCAMAAAIKEDFESAAQTADYEMALVYLNDKSVVRSIGHFFGVDDKKYVDKAIALLGTDEGNDLLNAMRAYIPCLSTWEVAKVSVTAMVGASQPAV